MTLGEAYLFFAEHGNVSKDVEDLRAGMPSWQQFNAAANFALKSGHNPMDAVRAFNAYGSGFSDVGSAAWEPIKADSFEEVNTVVLNSYNLCEEIGLKHYIKPIPDFEEALNIDAEKIEKIVERYSPEGRVFRPYTVIKIDPQDEETVLKNLKTKQEVLNKLRAECRAFRPDDPISYHAALGHFATKLGVPSLSLKDHRPTLEQLRPLVTDRYSQAAAWVILSTPSEGWQ